jgi:hypothetical protein
MSTASHATQQEIKKQEILCALLRSFFFMRKAMEKLLRMSFHKIQYLSVVGKDVHMRLQHAMIIVGMLERGSSSSIIVDDVSCRYTSRGTFLSLPLFILILCISAYLQFMLFGGKAVICSHLYAYIYF